MAALLVFNKFEVCKTLCIQVKITEQKEGTAQNRKQSIDSFMYIHKQDDAVAVFRIQGRVPCFPVWYQLLNFACKLHFK